LQDQVRSRRAVADIVLAPEAVDLVRHVRRHLRMAEGVILDLERGDIWVEMPGGLLVGMDGVIHTEPLGVAVRFDGSVETALSLRYGSRLSIEGPRATLNSWGTSVEGVLVDLPLRDMEGAVGAVSARALGVIEAGNKAIFDDDKITVVGDGPEVAVLADRHGVSGAGWPPTGVRVAPLAIAARIARRYQKYRSFEVVVPGEAGYVLADFGTVKAYIPAFPIDLPLPVEHRGDIALPRSLAEALVRDMVGADYVAVDPGAGTMTIATADYAIEARIRVSGPAPAGVLRPRAWPGWIGDVMHVYARKYKGLQTIETGAGLTIHAAYEPDPDPPPAPETVYLLTVAKHAQNAGIPSAQVTIDLPRRYSPYTAKTDGRTLAFGHGRHRVELPVELEPHYYALPETAAAALRKGATIRQTRTGTLIIETRDAIIVAKPD